MSALERRMAAKVAVLDQDHNVLLFRGGDPSRPEAGTWWFMPGGGLEPGESFEDAARRELREETGLLIDDVGPVVARRDVDFKFIDNLVHAHEAYFIVHTNHFEVVTDGWTDIEKATVVEYRWRERSALRTTTDTIYPDHLCGLIDEYLDGSAERSSFREL